MKRSKLIDLLVDFHELLEKFDYYLKFDFSKSIEKIQQLLFLIESESDNSILQKQLDSYFLKHELFDFIHILDIKKSIHVEKITKQHLNELLYDWYEKFLLLEPYLQSIFIDEDNHILELLCMIKYEGQYVTTEHVLEYINLCYLKDNQNY